MFELSVALKYLIPKRKQLSVTLIAIMSVGVISLVVWLVLVFLSVTEGMEKNWLKKLTDLNAPIKITPTARYYNSYYYRIDEVSEGSGYQYKTIGEKAQCLSSDPYDPEQDPEIPRYWEDKDSNPDGSLKDPVKIAYTVLNQLQKSKMITSFLDFEMSGALLKLQLLRSNAPLFSSHGRDSIQFLTQVSYLASFPSSNPSLKDLLIPPSKEDINHLLYLAGHELNEYKAEQEPLVQPSSSHSFQSQILSILDNVEIQSLETTFPLWTIPQSLLPNQAEFKALCVKKGNDIIRISLLDPSLKSPLNGQNQERGVLHIQNNQISFVSSSGAIDLSPSIPITNGYPLVFKLKGQPQVESNQSLIVDVETTIQGHILKGLIQWHGLQVRECLPKIDLAKTTPSVPIWIHSIGKEPTLPSNNKGEYGIVLPKGFKENGVMIGDRGYLSYNASTTSSLQEQRLGVFIAGFYDPGIMPIGNKCILTPKEITRAINNCGSSQFFDKIALNGIQVWLSNIGQAQQVKNQIEQAFQTHGIDSYFSVQSFEQYDFAKELLQQFQSDKYLFSLIAIIIITVACCNIISLLVLMVNDKKKEIGILLSMGASPRSIAVIFGFCGVLMGSIGCAIGCASAYFTVHHIDLVVSVLSKMQGHDAFSAAFYGTSLPDTLSPNAVVFVMIATPILALTAGLIPAIKACMLKPASILRSE